MKYSENYKLRLPQRGGEDGADDAADINDLTYDFEVLDAQLAACASACALLEQDKAETSALIRHSEDTSNPHRVTAEQLGLAALSREQLESILV